MVAKWIELVIGPLEQKKQYREAKARLDALPEPYRGAAGALTRYIMNFGGIVDGDIIVQMWVDLADLWERAAADGTSVGNLVGDDPVGFAETFVQAYAGKHWLDKERARLVQAIADATAGEQP